MESHNKIIKNITDELKLNDNKSNKKSQNTPQKLIYYNKTNLEETELNIPKQTSEEQTEDKISFLKSARIWISFNADRIITDNTKENN
jgi:hypothetical protein